MNKEKLLGSTLCTIALLLLITRASSPILAQSKTAPRQVRLRVTGKQEAQKPEEKNKTPEKSPAPETAKDKAWNVLHDGIEDKSAYKRAKAVRALGLLPGNEVAEAVADKALKDEKDTVRCAAAGALGSMVATRSIPELRAALDDDNPEVVLAAANSLMELEDSSAAYDIYYGVLTGQMRHDKGFVKEQLKTVQDPKKIALMGFEEGIGFVPFAGIGYSVFKHVTKSDGGGLRAGVAKRLALDPDPLSAKALVAATQDKQWLVRASALEAIAQRGDPALVSKIILPLEDEKDEVRYTAAACIIHLSDLPAKPSSTASAKK